MLFKKRSIPIGEIVCLAVVGVVLTAVLSPVIATGKGTNALASCQANLRRIGGAFKAYLSDWDGVYPTNRYRTNTAVGSYPNGEVLLSPVGNSASGKPYRGFYGTCWVEGLYDYIEPITSQTSPSVWKCPAAITSGQSRLSGGAARAAVTYLMNFNLLEQPRSVVRNPSVLMLCREADCLVTSACRGGNLSGGSTVYAGNGVTPIPISPFLTVSDANYMGRTGMNTKLHGTGSNILFVDGHAKCFDASSFPNTAPVVDTTYAAWGNKTSNSTVTITP